MELPGTQSDIGANVTKGDGQQPRAYSVWSDLRAMKFLGQVQQEMRTLRASNTRLQFLLGLSVLVLGGGLAVVAVFTLIAYNRISTLQQQIQSLPPQSSLPQPALTDTAPPEPPV